MFQEKNVLLVTRPLCPPWDEGSKNFAYFLAKSLLGIPVSILTSATIDDLPESVTQESIYTSGHFDLRAKVELFFSLFRFRNRFDITHYLFTPTKLNSWIIRHLVHPTRGKTIQTVATLREDLYSEDDLRKILFADRIITYADQSKHRLEEMGFAGVERIYPGIDLDFFKPSPKDPELLKRFGFEKDQFIVSYVGEYARLGATDMLADAIIRFHREHRESPIRFFWALRLKNEADIAKKAEVVQKFTDAGLGDRFHCSDTFDDVLGLYNLADVIAFPVSDMKGKFDIPLAVIEPYACAKPVILSDIQIFKEFSDDSFSVTVPRDDGKAFLSAVESLYNDRDRLSEMGLAARAYMEREFDLKDTAKRYAEIYKNF
ncbi:MAG: glycosyltransferase family 4 protein [Candidatus Moranbacteria bacterium]|nr:glycosyltransferase family 4 protein [Candidatus Moranbacteria bacterium]